MLNQTKHLVLFVITVIVITEFDCTFKVLFHCRNWIDANKTAKLDEPAPNPQMVDVRTGKLVKLIQNEVRPQILNFGSCT